MKAIKSHIVFISKFASFMGIMRMHGCSTYDYNRRMLLIPHPNGPVGFAIDSKVLWRGRNHIVLSAPFLYEDVWQQMILRCNGNWFPQRANVNDITNVSNTIGAVVGAKGTKEQFEVLEQKAIEIGMTVVSIDYDV